MGNGRPVRVLYSFPQRIGADRVCYTAWQQVRSLADAGAVVHVMAGATARPLPAEVRVETTLARGRGRLPVRAVGIRRACSLHDRVVARRLPALRDEVDVVHTWPLGAERTLAAARRLGIPTLLERPNAHTAFAFDAVEQEAARLGLRLPRGADHARDDAVLAREEREYELATQLLCPSEFVVGTFLERGFERHQLARHFYGHDPERYRPGAALPDSQPFRLLFAGTAAVRKGLHTALDAWLASPASREGVFLVAGDMLPAYREHLAGRLCHPSVQVLGHRSDLPELMRTSHALVLPSVEEGCALVCLEAMAAGSVPLVSEACTDLCRHCENALVHPVGDVPALTAHITSLASDRALYLRLRAGALDAAPSTTWAAAGRRLLEVYESVVLDERATQRTAAREP